MAGGRKGLKLLKAVWSLGPPVVPLSHPFGWEGSPTKIDYRRKGYFILTPLLEDLGPGKALAA